MQPDRIQVEELLRQRVDDARNDYTRATQEYKRLIGISHDVSDINDPAVVDGMHAQRRATLIYEHARRNYQQALRAFQDFVLHGKLPPEDQEG